MSKYKTIKTEIRTLDSLKKALADLDITPEIAVDPKVPSIPLIGYRGDTRPELASVAIRRNQVNRFSGGASNDIGFAWDGQGYQAIISDYDSTASLSLFNQVKQRYAYHEICRQAHAKGYTVRETTQANGVVRVVLAHR